LGEAPGGCGINEFQARKGNAQDYETEDRKYGGGD
jgi:hypothetical protein